MTEQPPSASAEAYNFALAFFGDDPQDIGPEELALALDRFAERVCKQRVSAETERCAKIAAAQKTEAALARHKAVEGEEKACWLWAFDTANMIEREIRAPAERPAPPQHRFPTAEQAEKMAYFSEDLPGVEQRTQETDQPNCGAARAIIQDCWGALNFILAFYEPGQRYLDTNAWKQAEASGRRAHAAARAWLDADKEEASGLLDCIFDEIRTATLQQYERAISDRDDLQRTFDLQWEADQRAIKRWQEAHPGNDLVWPDRANMVVWLMDQLDAATATFDDEEAGHQETLRLWQKAKQQHERAMAALREARMYMSKRDVRLVAQHTGIDVDAILGEPK